MRRFVLAMFALCIVLASTASISRAIGLSRSLDPDSFAAMLAEDTLLINNVWCWQQICPLRTSGDYLWRLLDTQAISDLRELSSTLRTGASAWQATLDVDRRLYFYITDSNLVRRLDLSDNAQFTIRGLYLGELLALFGTPVWTRTVQQSAFFISQVCFSGSVCANLISRTHPQLRAWSAVQSVSFAPAGDVFAMWQKWRGFRTYH